MIPPLISPTERCAVLAFVLMLMALNTRRVAAGDGTTRLEEGTSRALEYRVLEEQPPNTLIADVARDSGLHVLYSPETRRTFKYHLLSVQLIATSSSSSTVSASGQVNRSSLEHLFAVDSWTGMLRTSASVDREVICPRTLTCSLQIDMSVVPAMYFRVIKVTVDVIDINDNAPRFDEDPLTLDINELTSVGTGYPLPVPVDLDSGTYGVQGYRLSVERGEERLFELRVLNRSDGSSTDLFLVLTAQLDREVKARYSTVVTAFDGGIPRLAGALTVEISVTDANDNSPRFDRSSYEFTVFEDASAGFVIGTLAAHDADAGPNAAIVFSLTRSTLTQHGTLFRVDSTTGDLIVAAPLDYERSQEFSLGVMVTDSGHVPLSDYAKVFVRVLDVNDHAPHITVNSLTPNGIIRIAENAPIGSFVAHLSISDRDTPSGHVQVTCHLTKNPDFVLSPMGQSEFKVTSARSFDREIANEHVIVVTCKDHGQPNLVTSAEVVVHVTDENDCVPEFSDRKHSIQVSEGNRVGAVLARVEASDCDEGVNAQLVYSLEVRTPLRDEDDSRPALRIDPQNGTLRAALTFDYETQRLYEFFVIASDSGKPPLSSSAALSVVVLDVNDEAPKFLELNHTFHLEENLVGAADVGQVVAIDDDDYPFNQIRYSIRSIIHTRHHFGSTSSLSFSSSSSSLSSTSFSSSSSSASTSPAWPFSIDSITGLIRALGPLDRETTEAYRIVIEARNDGFPEMYTTADVILLVDDVNDNAPTMILPSKANETFSVSRHTKAGSAVLCISAEDRDSGLNAQIDFRLDHSSSDQAGLEIFEMEGSTACLTAKLDLSSYIRRQFPLAIIATDRGTPPLFTHSGLILFVNETADARASLFSFLGEQSWTTMVIVSIPVSTLVVFAALVICLVLRARRSRKRRERWNAKYGGQLELNAGCGYGENGPQTLSADRSTSSKLNWKRTVAGQLKPEYGEEYEDRQMEEDFGAGGDESGYNERNWKQMLEQSSAWHYRLPARERTYYLRDEITRSKVPPGGGGRLHAGRSEAYPGQDGQISDSLTSAGPMSPSTWNHSTKQSTEEDAGDLWLQSTDDVDVGSEAVWDHGPVTVDLGRGQGEEDANRSTQLARHFHGDPAQGNYGNRCWPSTGNSIAWSDLPRGFFPSNPPTPLRRLDTPPMGPARLHRPNANDSWTRRGDDPRRGGHAPRLPRRYIHFTCAGRQVAFREEEEEEEEPDDVTITSESYVVDLRDNADDSERHLPDICEDIVV